MGRGDVCLLTVARGPLDQGEECLASIKLTEPSRTYRAGSDAQSPGRVHHDRRPGRRKIGAEYPRQKGRLLSGEAVQQAVATRSPQLFLAATTTIVS